MLGNAYLTNNVDALVWLDGAGSFTIKECYKKILKLGLNFFSHGVSILNLEKIWQVKAPSKVNFCLFGS